MLDLFTNLGIVAGTLLALGAILKPLYMMVRRVEQVHNKVMVELPVWQEKVDKDLKQLYPNGGKSIHDQVGKCNVSIESVRVMLENHLVDTQAHGIPQLGTVVNVNTTRPDGSSNA